MLIRTLEQFVNDTGGGIAGGGGKDVESAVLAIEGLRTFSNAPPSVTDKSAYLSNMFPDYNKIAASLKAFKEKESVISFTSSFDSNAIRDAQSLMDALEYNNKAKSTLILANELKNTGQRRKSAVGIASSKQIQDAEAAKEKEQYEETERIVKEQKNLLERRIADSEKEKAEIAKKLKIAEDAAKSADNDKDRRIRDLEQALTAKLEKKADAEKDAMQQQFEELKLLMLSLHKKTDTIQEGVTEIATTTNQLLSTFQNFLTSDSPVPRLILIGPPTTSKEEITGKMDLEADIDKAHSMLSSPLTFAKSFMLTKTTAVVHVLCAYDISTCVSFEIKEPKEFIKKHAPAIEISLKVMKLAAFGTKLVTGIALPFTTPDTSTVDSFLDSASGMCDAAFDGAGLEGSEERAALKNIDDGGTCDAKTKAIAGLAFEQLKGFLGTEERMAVILESMVKVRGKDGIENWVSKANLDKFCQENAADGFKAVSDAAPVSKKVAEVAASPGTPLSRMFSNKVAPLLPQSDNLEDFLSNLKLDKYFSVLTDQEFDLDTVKEMSKQELVEAGLPLGAATKIIKFRGGG